MLVLFAEDHRDLAELTIDFLATEDIECDYAHNGEVAINLLQQHQYDVVVLDVNMPRCDGFAVCQVLKDSGSDTPVIFLTARDTLADKLAGFELGADDYLTKPFDLPELAARIKVLSQRKSKNSAKFILDTLEINYQQQRVSRAGQQLKLSPNQWQLLGLLAEKSPAVVDRITLENAIWRDQLPSKDMLKTLVFRLRSLVDSPDSIPLIHTIRGSGIALRVDL